MRAWQISWHLSILAMAAIASLNSATAEPLVYYDDAEVIDVTPIVSIERTATPHRECHTVSLGPRHTLDRRDRRPTPERSSPLPGLFGGLVGGAIGNRFGKGDGKKAMTVIGALAGASIANSAQNRDRGSAGTSRYVAEANNDSGRGHAKEQTRCRVTQLITETEQIKGYHVTYRYLDEQYVKTMHERPGENIRIRVEMTPQIETYFQGEL
jgi:uncharacterized protein YcfJ